MQTGKRWRVRHGPYVRYFGSEQGARRYAQLVRTTDVEQVDYAPAIKWRKVLTRLSGSG